MSRATDAEQTAQWERILADFEAQAKRHGVPVLRLAALRLLSQAPTQTAAGLVQLARRRLGR